MQAQIRPSSSRILQGIQKLNVLGNVLYFGAHPDDENPTFIAYLANEKLYNTAYFSLTRGDGGQNLIGTEIKENLGILRTQELLQARKIDGGQQFFSRAVDFGFSKSAEEVFTIWDREKLLSDAVWVIRNFKPDVIVTRFPPDQRAGHGHHIASAILAEEAFDAAADPNKFPEQLKWVKPWKTKRLVWNAGMWWNQRRDQVDEKDAKDYLKIDVGIFNPLLGKSYGEIAAESRSQHRSQGFGTIGFRGSLVEYFKHVKGDKASEDLMDGVDTNWSRVKVAERLDQLIAGAISSYQPANPCAVVPALLKIRSEIDKLPEGYWKQTKLQDIDKLIPSSLGLYLQATSQDYSYTPGEQLNLNIEAINRSSFPVTLKKVSFPFEKKDSLVDIRLTNNQQIQFSAKIKIPENTTYSQPYWLHKEGTLGLFKIDSQQEIGLAENAPSAKIDFELEIDGQDFHYAAPVFYRKTDPILGETYQPLTINPPAYVSVSQKVYLFDGKDDKKINVVVKAGKNNLTGLVKLKIPIGWRCEPTSVAFNLNTKGAEQCVDFQLFPPDFADENEITAEVSVDGRTYDRSQGIISYPHIPTQVFFPPAKAKVVRVEIKKTGNLIGYIKGAGDMVPASLQQIGYHVELLQDDAISTEKLQKYDAVIIGVRAYNIVERLKVVNPILLHYVENGGNLIVQYNADQGLLMEDFGPYPFKVSNKRVTVEQAEVRFLKPDCQALNYPNKITQKDFDGWVQERSLYQPENWSEKYETIISCNDPGSEKLDGGILIAKSGKGNYVYTTMSWFRQLPAGVPGAYRLFSNLISLGK
ncbi:PIG-L family deacetylase [Dyadobacter sp. LHD-138]|uniref:PIG-L family deacetylase n=1 Tax=Dyadobacter sp. LHD-138 TaxID=3071413 RepID=UPI0027E0D9DC|nr:PIG-L family deacetylase [Dyadobacter sp. LHD-138]MDQ6481309.1 PIG-L family deacetylase [Dyadobacter sp. LHD-138]